MDNLLEKMRTDIDTIDDEIASLFVKRMDIVGKVALHKQENKLPVLNSSRERDIISRVTATQNDKMAEYTKVLFNTIFNLSRSLQTDQLLVPSKTCEAIKKSIASAQDIFPKNGVVACQGIEGANSQTACEKLFSRPNIMYMGSFEAVFKAVDSGLCQYGILPIENSLHGSVTAVYDLMNSHKFHIAHSVKIKIDHCLIAKSGVKLSQIREIYSHEQALAQCSEFLKGLTDVKIIPCENTAIAAKMVANSAANDVCAISSKNCAELYGLEILSSDVQNNDNNYTRFICISKEMELFKGANKISLMFAIPHKPGSLYSIISRFFALGINLTKLESRPICGKDFEFMFYVDLDATVYSEQVVNLIASLEASEDEFAFLGCYGTLA